MAYGDDIDNLGADHRWDFDGNSNDAVGSANGTDTTMAYTGSPLTKDATNSATMNARTDRVSIPTTTTINNSAQARKAVCGWFMVDSVELPTCRIYGEGNDTTNFQFLILPGNSIVFEVRDGATWQIQIYSDIALEADRIYHLCGILEGNAYGNEVRFYIDGVEQTAAIPTDRQPDDASLASRGVAEFGDPAGTVGINGATLVMDGPGDNRTTEQVINAYYQHWAAWGDEADAVLTDTEVRETLFERGALAENTVSSGTESAMQTTVDSYGTQTNAACNIEVEAVTGGGDFELDFDQTFSDLASIHVRYNGTADTLKVRKVSGSNLDANKVSAPFGGSIEVVTEVDVTVTVRDAKTKTVIEGARVLLEADTGGPLTVGTDILSTTTNVSGVATTTFDWSLNQPVTGKVRKGSTSTYYKQGNISSTITEDGLDITVLLVPDE